MDQYIFTFFMSATALADESSQVVWFIRSHPLLKRLDKRTPGADEVSKASEKVDAAISSMIWWRHPIYRSSRSCICSKRIQTLCADRYRSRLCQSTSPGSSAPNPSLPGWKILPRLVLFQSQILILGLEVTVIDNYLSLTRKPIFGLSSSEI